MVPFIFLISFMLGGASAPAHAFDCAKASTDTEKLICADAELKAIDDKMGEHWSSMKPEFSKSAWKAMLKDQRVWLKNRDAQCAEGGDAERTDCLKAQTRNRIDAFQAKHRSGPGPSSELETFGIESDGGKGGYLVDFQGLRFANPDTPGEQVFNARTQKFYDEAPVETKVDFETAASLDFTQTMTVSYAAPHLLSVVVSTGRYDGGAHPNRYSEVVNIATDKGELTFADIFPQKAASKLAKTCFNGLKGMGGDKLTKQERKDRLYEATPTALSEMVGKLNGWAFSETGATILFPPYAIGPYAAGEFECELPIKLLRSLASNPDALPR